MKALPFLSILVLFVNAPLVSGILVHAEQREDAAADVPSRRQLEADASAAEKQPSDNAGRQKTYDKDAGPPPTLEDVPYGNHERLKLDFWKAESDKPTPVLFFIHGGSWMACHRLVGLTGMLTKLLDAGISVVSVEYRFIQEANVLKVVPPVKAPLHDAARALQLVRSKAAEWNLDKERIGASGTSAGACSSLWLAFQPDMADPDSADPDTGTGTGSAGTGTGSAPRTTTPVAMASSVAGEAEVMASGSDRWTPLVADARLDARVVAARRPVGLEAVARSRACVVAAVHARAVSAVTLVSALAVGCGRHRARTVRQTACSHGVA